jgi:hypothetical protein
VERLGFWDNLQSPTKINPLTTMMKIIPRKGSGNEEPQPQVSGLGVGDMVKVLGMLRWKGKKARQKSMRGGFKCPRGLSLELEGSQTWGEEEALGIGVLMVSVRM